MGWAHYELLTQVEDDAERKVIETEAFNQHWTTRELETRVRESNALAIESGEKKADDEPIELLKPRRGTPGLHLIVDRPSTSLRAGGTEPVVDLGFKLYRDLTSDQEKRLAKGDIVRLGESGVRKIDGATKSDLFTYPAIVRKVIDGDTLDVALEIAPGYRRELKLRLRGLDCPEVSTAAGRAAKAFVEGLLKPGDEVVISTTKPDKYERYLADVFIAQGSGDRGQATETDGEIFLNNALLEGGYAVRYDGVGPKEGE